VVAHLEPSTSMRQVACLHAYVLYGQHGSALYTTSSRYGQQICHKTHSTSRGLTPIFLLYLTDYSAILISVHAFSRISVPKTETRAPAKVKAPPRCLSGLLALLSALEKPQKLDGFPKMAFPT
jgi:hypothetical protein